jgi:hypothetical protein
MYNMYILNILNIFDIRRAVKDEDTAGRGSAPGGANGGNGIWAVAANGTWAVAANGTWAVAANGTWAVAANGQGVRWKASGGLAGFDPKAGHERLGDRDRICGPIVAN